MTRHRSAAERPIAVIGAGTMGAGVAQIFAQAGHPVRLQARKRETLEAALRRIRVNQDELIRHELLTAVDAEAARARITVTQALDEALAGAAFVSENIPELLPPKQALFAQMDRLAPPDTILSTNTSSLPITQVARDTRSPERVVGFHWFNPPHLIPLVEVIRGERTSDAAMDTTYRLAKAIGKSPIRVQKDIPGFVGEPAPARVGTRVLLLGADRRLQRRGSGGCAEAGPGLPLVRGRATGACGPSRRGYTRGYGGAPLSAPLE